MPALTASVGNIGRNSYMWRGYRPSRDVSDDMKVFVPAGFDAPTSSLSDAVSPTGNLDLEKFEAFFAGSALSLVALREIRLRAIVMGSPISEPDLKAVFAAYCAQLSARNVAYHYNADFSPFDKGFQGQSNCQGRAKGFLQLMAMLGVPKEQLNQATIGSASDTDAKVCRKHPSAEVPGDIFRNAGAPPDKPARNAVRITLKDGAIKVARTPRKPFANHYAAVLDVPGLGFKYWDPLLNAAYKNGFEDLFTSYRSAPSLLADHGTLAGAGLKCLTNPDAPSERLYVLPPSGKVPAANKALKAAMADPAFKAVEAELSAMSSESPGVTVIIDAADWPPIRTGGHPPVIKTLLAAG